MTIEKLKKQLQIGINKTTKEIDHAEDFVFISIDVNNRIKTLKTTRKAWQLVLDWIDKGEENERS